MILDLIRGRQQKILREEPIEGKFKSPEEILGDYILGDIMIPFEDKEFYIEKGESTLRFFFFSEWMIDTTHLGKEVTKFVDQYTFARYTLDEIRDKFHKYFGNAFSEKERDTIMRRYSVKHEELSYMSERHGSCFYKIVEETLKFDDFISRHEKNAEEIINRINENFIELIKTEKNFKEE